jgi:hypothetical protein
MSHEARVSKKLKWGEDSTQFCTVERLELILLLRRPSESRANFRIELAEVFSAPVNYAIRLSSPVVSLTARRVRYGV